MERPSFEELYMGFATNLAQRSTCLRGLKVGCVITSEDFRKVIAVGYNGNASGLANCCDRTGPEAVGNCGCLHAEENAVINCDVPRETSKIVFCTHLPCVMCAKRLINVGGVRKVIYLNDYRIHTALELLQQSGITVWSMPEALLQEKLENLTAQWHTGIGESTLEDVIMKSSGMNPTEYGEWAAKGLLPARLFAPIDK